MVKKTSKKSPKKPANKPVTNKIDFEPNKMTFAVAALAAVSLVLLGIITTL